MKVYLSSAARSVCSACNFETAESIFILPPDEVTSGMEVELFFMQHGGLCPDCFAAEILGSIGQGEQMTIERQ